MRFGGTYIKQATSVDPGVEPALEFWRRRVKGTLVWNRESDGDEEEKEEGTRWWENHLAAR